MIREVKMNQAVCDGCGRANYDKVEDKDDAVYEDIYFDAWRHIDGKLYCHDCYEYDKETDEYKPKVKEG
jgi:uncharacterized cysteine cluster protein YcgN (CxxCxxCC family)